jgi:hypothetical protein
VTATQAVAYLAKAREFLAAAQLMLDADNRSAATGNAVHAGISAGDAISCALTGTVSTGDHSDAAAHLKAIGGNGQQAARILQQLLPLKSSAEYDPFPVNPAAARKAVKAAERIVTLAERTIAESSSGPNAMRNR